jgi:hypothetical protein
MPTNISGVVILSSAGRLRVLLKSTRPLIPIEPAEGVEAALPRLAGSDDAALPGETAWLALDQIRQQYPRHFCAMLIQTADVPMVGPDGLTAARLLAIL